MKQRIKGLNRKVFYKELKTTLKKEYAKSLKYNLEAYVNDYEEKSRATGYFGWYELKSNETAKGYTQEIRTN